jgi:hypothetical protein
MFPGTTALDEIDGPKSLRLKTLPFLIIFAKYEDFR